MSVRARDVELLKRTVAKVAAVPHTSFAEEAREPLQMLDEHRVSCVECSTGSTEKQFRCEVAMELVVLVSVIEAKYAPDVERLIAAGKPIEAAIKASVVAAAVKHRREHGRIDLSCPECGRFFKTEGGRSAHLVAYHRKNTHG